MKRILSFVLVLAVLCSFGLAFAQETTTTATAAAVTINTDEVTKTSSGVSGTGKVSGNYTEDDQIRVAVVYENEEGAQILVINSAEIRADSTFKIPNVKASYGYTLQSVCLVVVNDDAAMDGAYGPYAVSDQVVL